MPVEWFGNITCLEKEMFSPYYQSLPKLAFWTDYLSCPLTSMVGQRKYKDLSILVRLEENSQKSTKVTQVKVDEY